MPASLLRRASRPAIAWYRGQPFFSKDAFSITPDFKPFAVESDSSASPDSRYGGRAIKTSFTPIGAWTAAQLAVLYPYAIFNKGYYTTPSRTVTAVNTGTGALTVTGHKQLTGTGVRLASTGSMPTGISATSTYYLNVSDANTLLLYDTFAHAIAGGDTGLITPSTAGTGTIKLIQNSPLLINYLDADQEQLVLHNSAISKMPSLSLAATKTAFGAVEFSSYPLHGMSWSDDDSVFTLGTYEEIDSAIDQTTIPTVPYSVAFGESSPFDDLQPRDGVMIDFNLKLGDIRDSNEELVTQRLEDLEVMIKLLPLNLTEADLWGELLFQGAGAGPGQSLPAAALTIQGPSANPYIEIYRAQFQSAPLKAGAKEDRIAEINFKSTQTWSGPTKQPIFYVGTEAP